MCFFLVPIFLAEKKTPTIPVEPARESTQALESVNEQLEKRIVRLPDVKAPILEGSQVWVYDRLWLKETYDQ